MNDSVRNPQGVLSPCSKKKAKWQAALSSVPCALNGSSVYEWLPGRGANVGWRNNTTDDCLLFIIYLLYFYYYICLLLEEEEEKTRLNSVIIIIKKQHNNRGGGVKKREAW